MEEARSASSLMRALAWLVGAALLLCVGFALVGMGWIALQAGRSEVSFDTLRLRIWWTLYATIVRQALLPHLLVSLLAWLAIARRFPSLEQSWPSLLAGLSVTAAGWFPMIGSLSFTAWSPTSPRDYVATLFVVTGGTTAALALPRRLFRSLAPGAFTSPRSAGREPGR